MDKASKVVGVSGVHQAAQTQIPLKVQSLILQVVRIAVEAVPGTVQVRGKGLKSKRDSQASDDDGWTADGDGKEESSPWTGMRPTADKDNGPAVLQNYVDKVFNERKAHPILLKLFSKLTNWAASEEGHKYKPPNEDAKDYKIDDDLSPYHDFVNFCIGFKYCMQLALKSFSVDTRTGVPGTTAPKFRAQILSLLHEVNTLMAANEPAWMVPCQRALMDNFLHVSVDLFQDGVVSSLRAGILVNSFFDACHLSLPMDKTDTEDLTLRKLKLLLSVVSTQDHLKTGVNRIPFLLMVCRCLNKYSSSERSVAEKAVCMKVLNELVSHLTARPGESKKETKDTKKPPPPIQIFQDKDTGMTEEDKQEEAKLTATQEQGEKDLRVQTALLLKPVASFLQDLLVARAENSFGQKITNFLPDEIKENKEAVNNLLPDTAVLLLALGLAEFKNIDFVRFDSALAALQKDQGREAEAKFLMQLFDVAQRLTATSAFNKYWLLWRMKELRFCIQIIEWTSSRLCQSFLAGKNFDVRVWRSWASLAAKIMLSEELNLETLTPEPKRDFINARYKTDLRMIVLNQLKLVWFFLGPRQAELIPALAAPFIDLTQSKNSSIQEAAKGMFFNLLQREFEATGSLSRVQYYTIDSIGRVVHEYQQSAQTMLAQFSAFFKIYLKDMFAMPANSKMASAGAAFLKDIDELFEYIVALESLPSKKKFEDERTDACFKLITYLKNSKKVDMYQKYVGYLCELQKSMGNQTELGNCLLHYQQPLGWSTRMLDAASDFPAQTESARKIEALNRAIKAFDASKQYELSVKVYQILTEAYESKLYDYAAVTRCLQAQSTYFTKIINEDRFFPAYYRVATYGPGFPADIRGQEFVYRSGDGEVVRDFTNRMKEKYPDAKIVNSSDLPPAWLLMDDKDAKKEAEYDAKVQYVQITTLGCSSEEEMNGQPSRFSNLGDVPPRVLKWHQNHNVKVFSFTRVAKEHKEAAPAKGKEKPNEFRDLWISKTFLVTAELLPALQRRVKVVERKELLLSPIETAVFNLVTKNVELKEQISMCKTSADPPLNPLSMALAGVIDAAVSGGIDKYREAFFDGTYLAKHPKHKGFIEQFKAALAEQVRVLKDGLEVFSAKCDKSLIPLCAHLTKTYDTMCINVEPLTSGQ